MNNTSLSGVQKIALHLVTILLVGGCVLFVLILSVLSSYDVKEYSDQIESKGVISVDIDVSDKLTGGILGSGYEYDIFDLNYNPQKSYRGVSEVGSKYGNGPILYNQENLAALKNVTIKEYKGKCKKNLIIVGIVAIGIWYLRKYLIKKFNNPS